MSSSVNGGHTFLTLSRFTFLWIRDFPNTGHKQSRGPRLTEASLALGWDWVMASQPSRWGGTLLRLKRLISGGSWRDQAVRCTQGRTPVPTCLLGDRGEMAASGDEEGRGHRCGALQPTSVYPMGRGALVATDVRWTLPATRDKNTVTTQSQQANVPRKLAVSLRRKLVSGEPYRDVNATWHSAAQVLLTWRGTEPAGTSQRIEPEGAWAALRTKKNIFLTLKSLPAPSRAGWERPDGPKLQLDLPWPSTAGTSPGTRVDSAEPSKRLRTRGALHTWSLGKRPHPQCQRGVFLGCQVGGLQLLWVGSRAYPCHGHQRAPYSRATRPVPFREGTRWHSFERVSPPSFAPHVQWEELS